MAKYQFKNPGIWNWFRKRSFKTRIWIERFWKTRVTGSQNDTCNAMKWHEMTWNWYGMIWNEMQKANPGWGIWSPGPLTEIKNWTFGWNQGKNWCLKLSQNEIKSWLQDWNIWFWCKIWALNSPGSDVDQLVLWKLQRVGPEWQRKGVCEWRWKFGVFIDAPLCY